jgi:ABC-type multidrug transport system permease subunit
VVERAVRVVRATGLTVVNEARLLFRDPVSLLMLLIAPVVIMTVAGYSLGALYGVHGRTITVPVIDPDGALVAELQRMIPADATIRFARATNVSAVRARVVRPGESPLAIEVPSGTTKRLASGHPTDLRLYVDGARRLEVNALELELGAVMRNVALDARLRAQRRLAEAARDLRHDIRHVQRAADHAGRAARRRLDAAKPAIVADARRTLSTALAASRRDVTAALRKAQAEAEATVAERARAAAPLLEEVRALDASRAAWEQWLDELAKRAGRHAADLPPPPPLPRTPAAADLVALTEPLKLPPLELRQPEIDAASFTDAFATSIDALAKVVAEATAPSADATRPLEARAVPRLPAPLGFVERSAVDGAAVRVNAFDQYVPGFGVTFLLIGMMLGISLTLFDERDWGTLERVRAGGASLAGILVGKVFARLVVGVVQMIILFAVGWAAFGVALGRHPSALLLPMIAMSFAGAALGLVIPTLAPAHDSVMPLGTMTSLTLAAIGGCWWPLDFEPAWMRALARWLPTTWTMQAYNDLMIHNAPASAAIEPFLVTMAMGVVMLVIGVAAGVAAPAQRR